MLEALLACFKQLALKPNYKWEWDTNDQWTEVLLMEFHSAVTPVKEKPSW